MRPSPSYQRYPLHSTPRSVEIDRTELRGHTVGAEEQQLGLVVKIHDLLFDTRCAAGDEKIDNGLANKHQSTRERCS